MSNDEKLQGRLEFLKKAERLKDTLRSAHTSQGRPESTAEHTWRLTLLVITLADLLPGVDLLRLLKLCILHDLGEAVGGDIPAPEQEAVSAKSDREREDFMSLLEVLPGSLKTEFLSLWDEYEDAQTREAQVAKALDKIETLLQHNQGDNPVDFDYLFNLEYGRKYTDLVPLASQIRLILDEETRMNAVKNKH